jgi:hypothetical protein
MASDLTSIQDTFLDLVIYGRLDSIIDFIKENKPFEILFDKDEKIFMSILTQSELSIVEYIYNKRINENVKINVVNLENALFSYSNSWLYMTSIECLFKQSNVFDRFKLLTKILGIDRVLMIFSRMQKYIIEENSFDVFKFVIEQGYDFIDADSLTILQSIYYSPKIAKYLYNKYPEYYSDLFKLYADMIRSCVAYHNAFELVDWLKENNVDVPEETLSKAITEYNRHGLLNG